MAAKKVYSKQNQMVELPEKINHYLGNYKRERERITQLCIPRRDGFGFQELLYKYCISKLNNKTTAQKLVLVQEVGSGSFLERSKWLATIFKTEKFPRR